MIKKIIILICTIIVLAIAIAIYIVQQPKQELETANKDTYDLEMLKTYDDSSEKSCSNPDKIIEGCKKGETVETVSKEGGFTAKFTCLGVIDDKVVDYKHFKLKNGNVLLYSESNPLKKAKVFDSKTNKFLEVSEDIKTTNYPVYTKKELPENLNFFSPEYLFDSNSEKFLKVNNNEYSKYKKFVAERKFKPENVSFIERFDGNKFLYAAKERDKDLGNHYTWLEEPLKLKRYKYGKLNLERDKFSAMTIGNGNVFIIGGSIGIEKFKDLREFISYHEDNKKASLNASLIEIYNYETGSVNKVGNIGEGLIHQKNLIFFDNTIYITNKSPRRGVETWKPGMSSTSTIIFEDTKNYFKVCPLLTKKMFIYGYDFKAGIYDIYNKITNTVLPITKRINPEITTLDNGKVLITGGQLKFKKAACYNTAELFEINFNR